MHINSKAERVAAIKNAQSIIDRAKAAGRDITPAEAAEIKSITDAIDAFDAREADAEKAAITAKSAALVAAVGAVDGYRTAPNGDPLSPKSLGRLSLKNLAPDLVAGMSRYSRALNAKGLTPSGEAVVAVPLVSPNPLPGTSSHERPPRLIDVLPAAARAVGSYSFLRQSVIGTPGAATVVEPGAVKPTKKLGIERVDATLKVIAVLSEGIDKYLLEDAGNLATWVASELADAIEAALETEVLSGDGTGAHFTGLANTTGIQTQTFQTDGITTVQHGLSKLETIGVAPQFVALAPADWLKIQTTRTVGGTFDVGGPISATERTAWGVQVVTVPGLPAGTGYVVGEDSLVISTDNAGVRVEWGTPGDSFTRNEVIARVEGRFNLDVPKPHGIVKLTLTGA